MFTMSLLYERLVLYFSFFAEIVKKVIKGVDFRPDTNDLNTAESVLNCMKSCWHEDPEARPDFRFVRVKLKEMQAGLWVLEYLDFSLSSFLLNKSN